MSSQPFSPSLNDHFFGRDPQAALTGFAAPSIDLVARMALPPSSAEVSRQPEQDLDQIVRNIGEW